MMCPASAEVGGHRPGDGALMGGSSGERFALAPAAEGLGVSAFAWSLALAVRAPC
jgi:hypothetical protein